MLDQALRLFPGYHYALAELAKVRSAQARHGEAVELLRRRYAAAPHPENLFDLAVALREAGATEEARALFSEFEAAALSESKGWDNANGELVRYYVERGRAADALRVAALEKSRRSDVRTLDAYAWALHASRRNAEAREVIESCLAIGSRDARVLYHAAAIASALGDKETAERELVEALRLNPRSDVATRATQLLAEIRERG
jgi:Flp pilus assembly protein TadD